ncbi:MAG: hypothetical protein WCP06_05335 [Verrucomicrobiota bacterium]
MLELEVYAAGVRNLEKILELDHELETIPGLRYKVDSNHDIVYMETDQPTFTILQVKRAFERIGLEPRFVGNIPPSLVEQNRKKTQPLL